MSHDFRNIKGYHVLLYRHWFLTDALADVSIYLSTWTFIYLLIYKDLNYSCPYIFVYIYVVIKRKYIYTLYAVYYFSSLIKFFL